MKNQTWSQRKPALGRWLPLGHWTLASTLLLGPLVAGASGPPPAVDLPLVAPRQNPQEVLPPLRRLMVLPITSNLEAFRTEVTTLGGGLGGVAAAPLGGGEWEEHLSQQALHILGQTGRFWVMGLDDTEGAQEATSTYGVEGWLQIAVEFSQSHTLVRLTLLNAQGAKPWLREEVLTNPMPTDQDMEKALASAVARLVRGVGFDGAITSNSGSYMTTDVGTHRGLSLGQTVAVGLVVARRRHPGTQEILSTGRYPIYTATVVRVEPTVAVLRINSWDEEMERKARANLGIPIGAPVARHMWLLPALPPSSPSPSTDAKAHPGAPPAPLAPAMPRPQPQNLLSPEPATAPPSKIEAGLDFWDEPWAVHWHGFSAGLGTTYGILNTSRGNRYTDQPPVLLNTFLFQSGVSLKPGMIWEPALALSLYQGGDVTGWAGRLESPILAQVGPRGGAVAFWAGLGVDILYGHVETIRVKRPLGDGDVFAMGQVRWQAPGFGAIGVAAGLSLVAPLGGALEGFFDTTLQPFTLLPKALSFHFRLRQGPHNWQEVLLGATWAVPQTGGGG